MKLKTIIASILIMSASYSPVAHADNKDKIRAILASYVKKGYIQSVDAPEPPSAGVVKVTVKFTRLPLEKQIKIAELSCQIAGVLARTEPTDLYDVCDIALSGNVIGQSTGDDVEWTPLYLATHGK
jgi:hypothetical protein